MDDQTTVITGTDRPGRTPRRRIATRLSATLALTACVILLTGGCLFFPYSVRNEAAQPQALPWWCTSAVNGDLAAGDCRDLSAQLDVVLTRAYAHWHASDAIADGATGTPYAAGRGAAFTTTSPTASFNPNAPDTYLYDGTDPTAQLVGIEWNVAGAGAPAGFSGANDVWSETSSGVWTLRAWIVRPFENQVDVFATTHPCLTDGAATRSTTAACYTQTHPRALEIVVTNDDGYRAPGIDQVVQGLIAVPGVHVTVVAPATNQSGVGDRTTPGGVTAFAATTASGYPATAVQGTPADSVVYALNTMHLNPDLVVSGINLGQNLSFAIPLSGTVGAARTAARNGIPALAASQGGFTSPDYPAGTTAVLHWLDEFRLGRTGAPAQVVSNLNVPTCTSGAIRGTLVLPASGALNGRPYDPSDCTSTATTFADDLDGFLAGYITLSDVGL
jgi:5'-nucleotidase